MALRWRHNDHAGVSNHQPHGCLLNRLFRRNSKKTSKLRVTGLCAGNSPGTGEFPAQMASYAENVSIWWRHHGPSDKPLSKPIMVRLLTHLCVTQPQWVNKKISYLRIRLAIRVDEKIWYHLTKCPFFKIKSTRESELFAGNYVYNVLNVQTCSSLRIPIYRSSLLCQVTNM